MSLTTGVHTYLCDPQFRGDMNNIIIGNYSSVASGVVFDCGFQHQYKNVTSFPLHKLDSSLPSNVISHGDIIVGNDVWIGEGAMIMGNVTIGDGAVIGARSIITKDVNPYFIVVGENRVLDRRFTFDRVQSLKQIAWWNWPDERVLKNAHLLLSEDIDNFINNHI